MWPFEAYIIFREKKVKFFSDFKAFISKGNILDMAVGVIIGGAFQAIVNSLVNDVVSPVISLATKGINFADKFLVLAVTDEVFATAEAAKEAAKEAEEEKAKAKAAKKAAKTEKNNR